eukprot:CAMPEP_0194764240 /NCGR_PEP_ID=MMETSP0323_2-20130528/21776_1 /TAXON_ID=2866 ORGANISM="Crypthecodinium cohnii, Strain Seligo" /NCGR_SAMPLE_ID=MMETSP0323_2 /ASSEMBLY_ACC=CAM_ASM_000346 /LENGTH=106 /DNA_ID=CAMNT_0039690897 /DNA_START=40 /DNA_END=360 /DNA_ORIENTATION=-
MSMGKMNHGQGGRVAAPWEGASKRARRAQAEALQQRTPIKRSGNAPQVLESGGPQLETPRLRRKGTRTKKDFLFPESMTLPAADTRPGLLSQRRPSEGHEIQGSSE